MPINKTVYVVVFSISSAIHATPHLIESVYAGHVTQCSLDSMALYCVESNTTPFHLTHQLSTDNFPEYMYVDHADKPKGLFHYLSKGLSEGNMAGNIAAYQQEQTNASERARLTQRYTRSLRYLEKAVLPYDISTFNAPVLMNHMEAVRQHFLGSGYTEHRENAQLVWHSDLMVLHKGADYVASALSYLQSQGITQKERRAWKNFWHSVRQRGKGIVLPDHVADALSLWDEQGRGSEIRALFDQVCFIAPARADMHATLERDLDALRAMHEHDSVGRAAHLYRSLIRVSPFKGYNALASFTIMNAMLTQNQQAPLPFLYESHLSSIALYSSLEFFTAYVRLLTDRVSIDLERGVLDPQYGYSERALALIRGLDTAQ